VTFTCSCGATFVAGSTSKDSNIHVDICSNCHPFYTGNQKFVDTQGVVTKFQDRMKKSAEKQTAQKDLLVKRGEKALEREERRKEKLAKELGIKDLSKILSRGSTSPTTKK